MRDPSSCMLRIRQIGKGNYPHVATKGSEVKNWSAALQLLVVGFYVPLSLLMPTGIGFWLDRSAGHRFPSYSLFGLGLGTVIMVYGVYRMVRPFLEEAREEGREKETHPPAVKTEMSISIRTKKGKEGKS